MGLTIGIDEVGYGPKLGPLVVVAAAARRPLRAPVRIGDSKKVYGGGGMEALAPAVLGFLPASDFGELLEKLSTRLPDAPWYRKPLPLPAHPRLPGLEAACARFVEPDAFNAAVAERNKSDLLFELAADLVNGIRARHKGPFTFLIGKQGGRKRYRAGLERLVHPRVKTVRETAARSSYAIPGAKISFLRDAEEHHELVALASMIGKYARECAMSLFNAYWQARVPGLRRTAGYPQDAPRFFRRIEPELEGLGLDASSVLRAR